MYAISYAVFMNNEQKKDCLRYTSLALKGLEEKRSPEEESEMSDIRQRLNLSHDEILARGKELMSQ